VVSGEAVDVEIADSTAVDPGEGGVGFDLGLALGWADCWRWRVGAGEEEEEHWGGNGGDDGFVW
ncbi:MAG: hypothetical protein ACI8RZ_004688, partial [Myxococcota bacterium]